MKNFNDVYLMGRPTDTFKIRDRGKPYVRFTLALTSGSKSEFIPVIYYGDDMQELAEKITTRSCLLIRGSLVTNRSEHVPPVEVRASGIEVLDQGNILAPLNRFFISCSPAGEAEVKKTRDGRDYVRLRVCVEGYRRNYLTVIAFDDDVVRRLSSWTGQAGLMAIEGRIKSVKDDECPEINMVCDHVYVCRKK